MYLAHIRCFPARYLLCHSTYPSCHSDAGGIYYLSHHCVCHSDAGGIYHYPLSFRRRRNLSLLFVIPLILLAIPTQEESIITLCHSNPLSLSFRHRRNLLPFAFVIPLILLVISTQEESIRNCHVSYVLLSYMQRKPLLFGKRSIFRIIS